MPHLIPTRTRTRTRTLILILILILTLRRHAVRQAQRRERIQDRGPSPDPDPIIFLTNFSTSNPCRLTTLPRPLSLPTSPRADWLTFLLQAPPLAVERLIRDKLSSKIAGPPPHSTPPCPVRRHPRTTRPSLKLTRESEPHVARGQSQVTEAHPHCANPTNSLNIGPGADTSPSHLRPCRSDVRDGVILREDVGSWRDLLWCDPSAASARSGADTSVRRRGLHNAHFPSSRLFYSVSCGAGASISRLALEGKTLQGSPWHPPHRPWA